MTDIFDFLWSQLNIDAIIVLLVFLSGFFQEKYFRGFWIVKDPGYDATLKTLFLSFVVSMIYIRLMYITDKNIPIPWAKYFLSYFTATSIYELVIDPFRKWIKKKFGNKEDEKAKSDAL